MQLPRLRVGWIADEGLYVGGAELTEQQFVLDAPQGVDIARLAPPASVFDHAKWRDVDVFVVHNCTDYDASILPLMRNRVVVKYVHDVWPVGDRVLRNWLLDNACLMFTSPLHVERFPFALSARPVVVPPAIPLQLFRDAAKTREQLPAARALYLAHHAKGIEGALAWADENGIELDVYGHNMTNAVAVDYADVPALMARYSHFVHLPEEVEPFGRTVVEAWAAGCKPVVNDNVGAKWFMDNRPDLLAPGAASLMFWRGVATSVTA